MAKKLKDFIKINPEPAKGTNFVNPSQLGQYSAQNQVNENNSLSLYLRSKGINPEYLSVSSKISHSKSAEFLRWQKQHMYEDLTMDRTAGTDNRSKTISSPTLKRRNELDKAVKHYMIKPVSSSIKKEDNQTSDISTQDAIFESKPLSTYDKFKRNLKKGGFDIDAVDKKIADSKVRQAQQRSEWDSYEKSKMKRENFEIKTYMTTEDMHDWEKEDKSIKTYGRKPKFDKGDEKLGMGENKPTAVAILSGGTTLTGSNRDIIEIDPAMRNRPGQPEVAKKDQTNKKNKDK
jgi:hypothetical protein